MKTAVAPRRRRGFLSPGRLAAQEVAQTVPGTVSYIIPAYNAERTLAEAVRSVQWQGRRVDQIVIVDDASTDETWQVAQDLARGRGEREVVTLRHRRNLGAAATRNDAIRSASGEYVFYLDADDVAPPERTEICLGLFENTGALLIYGQKEVFASDCNRRHGTERALWPTPENLVGGTGCGTGSVAVRRALHIERGIWMDESMSVAEDAELLVACLAAGIVVCCSEEVLCWRRERAESLRHRGDWGLMRRWIATKHAAFLAQWSGRRGGMGAVEQEETRAARRDAGWQ